MFEAIAQMENNKAPGPDGFPAEFYKKVLAFHKGRLDADVSGVFCGAASVV